MSFASLVAKDLRREGRSKDGLQAGVVLVASFAILYLLVFPDLSGQIRAATAVVWTPLLYGAAAIAGRGLAHDHDRGTIDLLRSAPVPLAYHGVSRTLVDLILLAVLAAITITMAALLFAVPVDAPLLLVTVLAVLGLAIVGSVTGGLAAQARSRDALLPILLVPVVAPLLVSGVRATMTVLAGAGLAEARSAILLMVGYDIIAAGVAWLLWPFVLEGD